MNKQQFIDKIKNGNDIMLDVLDKHYTILTWCDEGICIAEQYTSANEAYYDTAENLVENYLVHGIPIGEISEEIKITFYT